MGFRRFNNRRAAWEIRSSKGAGFDPAAAMANIVLSGLLQWTQS